jgi:peptidoglycan/LPS O-acetylase OafA/YrhL
MPTEVIQSAKQQEFIGNIQTLRFFAALWVFLLHLKSSALYHIDNTLVNSVIDMGFAGVDIFFVISGYIMSIALEKTPPGLSSGFYFLLNRFLRIYSGWWPYFFAYLALYAALGQINADQNIIGSFFLAPLYLQSYLVPVTWTLSFELYFYTVLAFILLFTRKFIPLILGLLGIGIAILAAVCFSNGIYSPQGVANATRLHNFYGYVIILEFIFGYLLGSTRRHHRSYMLIPAGILLLVLGSVAFLYQNSGNLYPSGMAGFYHAPERVMLIGGASVCLVLIASRLNQLGFTPFPALQALGNASYSLYLGHILSITLISSLVAYFLPGAAFSQSFVFTMLIIFIVIYVTWWISNKVERPLNKMGKLLIYQFSHSKHVR